MCSLSCVGSTAQHKHLYYSVQQEVLCCFVFLGFRLSEAFWGHGGRLVHYVYIPLDLSEPQLRNVCLSAMGNTVGSVNHLKSVLLPSRVAHVEPPAGLTATGCTLGPRALTRPPSTTITTRDQRKCLARRKDRERKGRQERYSNSNIISHSADQWARFPRLGNHSRTRAKCWGK